MASDFVTALFRDGRTLAADVVGILLVAVLGLGFLALYGGASHGNIQGGFLESLVSINSAFLLVGGYLVALALAFLAQPGLPWSDLE